MLESGPRKRDEDGDVDEDDHHVDDSPLDGTPAPPRERRRGLITHKYRGSQQFSRVEYSTQIY